MKTKFCKICKVEEITLYRIQISKDNIWIFVCKSCCTVSKNSENYKYGGTWKGSRQVQ